MSPLRGRAAGVRRAPLETPPTLGSTGSGAPALPIGWDEGNLMARIRRAPSVQPRSNVTPIFNGERHFALALAFLLDHFDLGARLPDEPFVGERMPGSLFGRSLLQGSDGRTPHGWEDLLHPRPPFHHRRGHGPTPRECVREAAAPEVRLCFRVPLGNESLTQVCAIAQPRFRGRDRPGFRARRSSPRTSVIFLEGWRTTSPTWS